MQRLGCVRLSRELKIVKGKAGDLKFQNGHCA
jgi:hypothetical protein